MSRIHEGLAYLAAEASASPDEFRKANHPGGDMLLTAMLSKGYARDGRGRVALSEQGRRMHAAECREPASAD